VASETGVVMIIYLDEAYHRHREAGRLRGREDIRDAVHEGALLRLRPVMMTVTAVMAGLAPILWGSGTGADVMKRIAAPMVGGMVTATILTLAVVPAIYYLWRSFEFRPQAQETEKVPPRG
jgi:copper/silver efflux system protein